MIQTTITEIKRWHTKANNRPMWIMTASTGETVFVTEHTDPLRDGTKPFIESGFYPHMFEMNEGDIQKWKSHPIPVKMTQEGVYYRIIEVLPLDKDATPDKQKTPDFAIYRQYAIDTCQMIYKSLGIALCVDTETDSLDIETSQIVQLGLCGFNSFQRSIFIKPDENNQLLVVGKSGKSATDVHGLTPEFLSQFASFKDQAFLMKSYLNEAVWIIYNASYDMPIIRNNFVRSGLVPPVPLGYVDLMKVISYYFGLWSEQYEDWTSIKLEDACERLGVVITKAHDALGDAMAYRDIIYAICHRDYLENNEHEQVDEKQ